ncbi:MAG TPA: efflux transporter outer membrane subunit [Caulobacteraceae bacterium]|jgi:NodT family efflux transporter outer membrane factor (OMF) lipoprotein|nr:efflux transporter outer membrane subunit [Caulobacteraceae bacterium]
MSISWTARSAAFGAGLLLAGCAVGPTFAPPASPHANDYGAGATGERMVADGAVQQLELGKPADPRWWTLYGSPALDELVAQGLRDSPNLTAAREALSASRYEVEAGAGLFWPVGVVSANAGPHRGNPAAIGFAGDSYFYRLYTLDATVAYAIDLFGGQRRQVESLAADAQAHRYAVGSAYLLLTGSIVQTAIARAAYADEIATLEDIVQRSEAQRDTIAAQVNSGHLAASAQFDLDSALAQAKSDLAQARQHEAASAVLLHTLLGREPGEALSAAPVFDGLRLPEAAPVDLPSALVHDRPDILQAEAALHKASADVGVATAALYPQISLTGDYGRVSGQISSLPYPVARYWSVGPAIDLPIFSGGTRWYERRAAQANLRSAAANYRATVLSALEQTSDAIRALDSDAANANAARVAFDAAQAKAQIAVAQRRAGLISDADANAAALDADRARLALIGARAQRLQDTAALYLATGGGWTGQTD